MTGRGSTKKEDRESEEATGVNIRSSGTIEASLTREF